MEDAQLDARETALCTAVDDAFETEQVTWLTRLIEQPSHTEARENVEATAALIDEQAKLMGMGRRTYPDPDGRFADHRIFTMPTLQDEDAALALVGHCDTVYPEEMGFLKFRRDPPDAPSGGDQIRGPGVLDMKSGLSVIVFALHAVAKATPDLFRELRLRFFCNTDEEVGSPSSSAMFREYAPRISRAMVFEGGRDEDRIITARKGTGAFTLKANGKSAHAGNDHVHGVSAIHALALLVPKIEALTDYERGTTTNVGTFHGGISKNTVPGEASCVVDVRVSSMAEQQRIESALQAMVADPFSDEHHVPERLRQIRISLGGGMRRSPLEPTPESQQLRAEYEQAAAKVGLGIGEAPLQGGGSDAYSLAEVGVPVIDGLGPFGKAFHSPDEWSSLDSLRRRTQALACFLVRHATGDAR